MKFVTIIEICTKCNHEFRYRIPVKEPNIFASPVRQTIPPEKCRWCFYKKRYEETQKQYKEAIKEVYGG